VDFLPILSIGLHVIIYFYVIVCGVCCWAINLFPGSFVLTGLTEAIALPYLGIKPDVVSLDVKAEILLLDQGYAIPLDSLTFVILEVGW